MSCKGLRKDPSGHTRQSSVNLPLPKCPNMILSISSMLASVVRYVTYFCGIIILNKKIFARQLYLMKSVKNDFSSQEVKMAKMWIFHNKTQKFESFFYFVSPICINVTISTKFLNFENGAIHERHNTRCWTSHLTLFT